MSTWVRNVTSGKQLDRVARLEYDASRARFVLHGAPEEASAGAVIEIGDSLDVVWRGEIVEVVGAGEIFTISLEGSAVDPEPLW